MPNYSFHTILSNPILYKNTISLTNIIIISFFLLISYLICKILPEISIIEPKNIVIASVLIYIFVSVQIVTNKFINDIINKLSLNNHTIINKFINFANITFFFFYITVIIIDTFFEEYYQTFKKKHYNINNTLLTIYFTCGFIYIGIILINILYYIKNYFQFNNNFINIIFNYLLNLK